MLKKVIGILIIYILTYIALESEKILFNYAFLIIVSLISLLYILKHRNIIKSNYKFSIVLCFLAFLLMEHNYIDGNNIHYFNIVKDLFFIGIIFVLSCIFMNLINNNRFFNSEEKEKRCQFLFYLIPLIPLAIEWILNLPGKFSTDSIVQLQQIITNTYSDVHPAAHTLFCKLLMQIFDNPGTVIFFQILSVVLINGYIFSYFYKKGISLKFLLPLLTIWSLLGPVRDVTCYFWKDVFFTVGILLLTVVVIKIIDNKNECKIFDLILGGLALGFIVLFRHNGIFIYIFSVIIFTFLAIKYHKKILLPVLISTLLIISVKGIIYPLFDVAPNDNGTKYALPAKAIVSVVYYDGNYTEEELSKIELLLPKDLIEENYCQEDGKTLLWYELHSENGFVRQFPNFFGR